MAEDGSVLVSLRHLDQIVSISPDFKKIQWRIGGPGSDYVFPQASDRFYEPHTAIPLANGHILMFDNGNDRPNEEGGQYSRALELEVDHKNKTVRKIWEFVHDPLIFSVSVQVWNDCLMETHLYFSVATSYQTLGLSR